MCSSNTDVSGSANIKLYSPSLLCSRPNIKISNHANIHRLRNLLGKLTEVRTRVKLNAPPLLPKGLGIIRFFLLYMKIISD